MRIRANWRRRSPASEFELVAENGAPSGEKYVVFYNPPVVNKALGIRRSYLNETRRIARELLDRGQQTLVFANSRLATEVLLTYLKGRTVPAAASAAIAADICPRNAARSSASCAMAIFARWWRRMRWSWASTSARSTRW